MCQPTREYSCSSNGFHLSSSAFDEFYQNGGKISFYDDSGNDASSNCVLQMAKLRMMLLQAITSKLSAADRQAVASANDALTGFVGNVTKTMPPNSAAKFALETIFVLLSVSAFVF